MANLGPSCWHLVRILRSLKPWRIRIGPRSFGVGPSSAVFKQTKGLDGQKRFVHRHLHMKPAVYFGAVTLLRQDIHLQSQGQGNSLVMFCLVVFFFQNQILKYLTHSINAQMESLHIEPVWGCDPSHKRLCGSRKSASLHRGTIARIRKGFCRWPCTVTRLQCWGSMAIPSRERTQKVLMRVWWLKEHDLHLFAAIVGQF